MISYGPQMCHCPLLENHCLRREKTTVSIWLGSTRSETVSSFSPITSSFNLSRNFSTKPYILLAVPNTTSLHPSCHVTEEALIKASYSVSRNEVKMKSQRIFSLFLSPLKWNGFIMVTAERQSADDKHHGLVVQPWVTALIHLNMLDEAFVLQ